MKKEINTPYLIQRLKLPFNSSGLLEALSFGGGLSRGGISKEAFDIISKIWSYDYMGSAEFEWGDVPKSLDRIVRMKNIVAFDFTVTATCYDFRSNKKLKNDGVVYVLCDVKFKDTIKEYISNLAKETNEYHTKEWVGLNNSICNESDVVGWHDIRNDYLFFTNKEMFINFCQLIDIKPDDRG